MSGVGSVSFLKYKYFIKGGLTHGTAGRKNFNGVADFNDKQLQLRKEGNKRALHKATGKMA